MRKLLCMIGTIGITVMSTSSVVSCVTVSLHPTKINLNTINLNTINNYVNNNNNVTDQDIVEAINNIQAQILQQFQANDLTSKVTENDFTTDVVKIVKPGDLSQGVTVTIIATSDSLWIYGSTNISVSFINKSDANLDLRNLKNAIEYKTSGTLISEVEAKQKWFDLNMTELRIINENVNISWFTTINFSAGNKNTLGNIDISATTIHNKQFTNTTSVSIKTIIKQSGTIDDSAANQGMIESIATTAMIQLSNGTILVGSFGGSIYKLTDEGKIDHSVGDGTGKLDDSFDNSINSFVELTNGLILAGTSGGLIYKLTAEGKNDNILEDRLDHDVFSLVQLSNGTILAGTLSNSIYKLTSEGKIDTSVGNGTGKIEDKTFDGVVTSITELSNGTILAGTNNGSIYKLTDEGKIDTSVGNGTGKILNNVFTTYVRPIIFQLVNGTILVGIGNSIYKLTDEGKIDKSVGNGTGKIEDKFRFTIATFIELSNGIFLAGTSGGIYKLVN
ncbi:hypothetical protein [Spiroplasma endosymbiont of Labia minor]|uniref:hypothetical protein n=1 Tax=Spiroplasma endosymbiont of Labia minor TaxID=3066305 RepID=UPI0030D3E178